MCRCQLENKTLEIEWDTFVSDSENRWSSVPGATERGREGGRGGGKEVVTERKRKKKEMTQYKMLNNS